MSRRLDASFYDQSTRSLAKALLGKSLVRLVDSPGGCTQHVHTQLAHTQRLSGIVVEVEAYLSSGDPASHSDRGQGNSNASMFGNPGTLYVYPIHSRHCLNVVAESVGRGAAVLVRALEPTAGVKFMAQSRGLDALSLSDPDAEQFGKNSSSSVSCRDAVRLTTGPGRLCQALQVDRTLDGVDLLADQRIWLEEGVTLDLDASIRSRSTPRIGISKAKERRLRWFLDGNRFVSGCARDHSAGRTWTFGRW